MVIGNRGSRKAPLFCACMTRKNVLFIDVEPTQPTPSPATLSVAQTATDSQKIMLTASKRKQDFLKIQARYQAIINKMHHKRNALQFAIDSINKRIDKSLDFKAKAQGTGSISDADFSFPSWVKCPKVYNFKKAINALKGKSTKDESVEDVAYKLKPIPKEIVELLKAGLYEINSDGVITPISNPISDDPFTEMDDMGNYIHPKE